jgi:hypothetical protein
LVITKYLVIPFGGSNPEGHDLQRVILRPRGPSAQRPKAPLTQ